MKIAFISYEYPPDTADGGIATYTQQAAQMLVERGHSVEVFAGTRKEAGTLRQNGVLVHRIYEERQWEFHRGVPQTFVQRHAEVGFDVVESPEYHAATRAVMPQTPDLPLVIKLHTPSYMMQWIGSKGLSKPAYLRGVVSGVRRGTGPLWHPCHPRSEDERLQALAADEVTAPCLAIANRVARDWHLPPERVSHVPLVYVPSQRLLDIPVETNANRVTYLGRLEFRKGVRDLACAIPQVLAVLPKMRFRFVGADVADDYGVFMMGELKKMLGPALSSVEFTGPRPLVEIPALLADTDICVFPSLWENFPLVCLESMAAARGVIGSRAGGMAEQLDEGRCGRLISPQRPDEIAKEIIFLAQHPEERQRLGREARARVLEMYNKERIGRLQEESYQRAIDRKRQGRVLAVR